VIGVGLASRQNDRMVKRRTRRCPLLLERSVNNRGNKGSDGGEAEPDGASADDCPDHANAREWV